MGIDKEQLREQFKRLSTRYGGSLLTEPQLLDQKNITVMFGLGGLGCRAVNTLKSISNEKLNNPDWRFFRVFDTCLSELDDISEVTTADITDPNQITKQHGCISTDEKVELYDRAHPFKISDLDSSVDSWLDRESFKNVTVDGRGAQAIRQIGRVMFYDKYNTIYNVVSRVLSEAKSKAESNNNSVKVYIIAGIGGGTGSGTVVDFSFMVRKIIEPLANIGWSVEGVIFTPDVQEQDAGMTPEKYISVQRNFYAAIKEIDYFYNNIARSKAYKCPFDDSESRAYGKDIFDECTIISRMASGSEIARNSDEVIVKLAEALTFEMSGINITSENGTVQSYDAYFSNTNDQVINWLQTPLGKAMNLPDWIPMRYSSLGYSSFYVPRDELLAYCANRMIEHLIDQWNKRNITEDQVKSIMRSCSLDSNRSFVNRIFKLAKCSDDFEIEKAGLPKDGLGLLPVKNCESYAETMHEIAIAQSRKTYIDKYIRTAERSRKSTFVDPIISEIDKAFYNQEKGPVYAINLLSAGFDSSLLLKYNDFGVLVRIANMISELSSEASKWKLELEQSYNALIQKADLLDGKISADASELDAFTNSCRQNAEDYLKAHILEALVDYLKSIYDDLNEKNNRIFNVYTTTLELLLEMLGKDSQYISNTDRKREGHTTIFSFDVANFEADDPKSKRFTDYFDSVVDKQNLDTESSRFVNKIFGKIKDKFDPVSMVGKDNIEADEDDIIEIIREYFNECFSEWAAWTDDVIEKFCVIAYSNIDVTPEILTKVWDDTKLKNAALQNAASDIEISLVRESAVMLTAEDPTKNIENYANYTAFTSLGNTQGLNNYFARKNSILQSNWPEFIRYKRVIGIQLGLIDGLKKYKKIYDSSTTPGLHLDEVDDNWRYSMPEPFSYNVSKMLRLYREDGNDVTETDRLHMLSIFNMAKKAYKYELLKENNSATVPYFELYYKLLRPIDFFKEKDAMYEKLKAIIKRNVEDGRNNSFISVLVDSGYALDEAIPIRWRLRPEHDYVKNKTDFGDDIVFGNFITFIRSNYEWEEKLKEGIVTFERIYDLYESALNDLNTSDRYGASIKEFARAIRVGMIEKYTNSKTGKDSGYKLQYGRREEDFVFIDCTGWDYFDKKYILYLFFVEVFMKLDEKQHISFRAYLDKYEMEGVAETTDVSWLYKEVSEILDDPEYLGQYVEIFRNEAFESVIGDARHLYEVPEPSNNNKNIPVVVSNLKNFYNYLKAYLEKNGKIS